MAIYEDLNKNYKTLAGPVTVVDGEAINSSIDNILLTAIGSRFFNRSFGSLLKSILFEPMNDITAARILNLVVTAIERWEPRIRVDFANSSVVPDYDNNLYKVVITYVIQVTGDLGQFDTTFELETGIR